MNMSIWQPDYSGRTRGRQSRNELLYHNILFVCSVSKGRSPLCASHFNHYAKEQGLSVIALAAGSNYKKVKRFLHEPASSQLIHILNENGIYEINEHVVKPVEPQIGEWADLILPVGKKNADQIVSMYKDCGLKVPISKIHLAKEFAGMDEVDIRDAHSDTKGKIYKMQEDGTKIYCNTPEAMKMMVDECREVALGVINQLR